MFRKRAAWLALTAVLTLVISPPVAMAGGCRTRAIYSTYSYTPVSYATYSTAAYVAPAVTYAAPIKAVKAFISPDYYSSVSDHYRDKLLVDAVAGRTAELVKGQEQLTELRSELQLLRRQLQFPQQPYYPPQQQYPPNGGQQYQPPAQQQPPAEQPGAPAPEPSPRMPRANGGGDIAGGQSAVAAKLAPVVEQSCLRCHGASNASAGNGIDLRNLSALPWQTALLCYEQVNTGAMPKGGKPLSDEAVLQFHQLYKEKRQLAQR